MKFKVIHECCLGYRNIDVDSFDVAFYAQIPEAWLKKEVRKLFRSLIRSNSRANYLRKSIAQARLQVENATCSSKYLPYARNFTELKIYLDHRFQLGFLHAIKFHLPKHVVEEPLPNFKNKKADHLLQTLEKKQTFTRSIFQAQKQTHGQSCVH